MMKQIRKFVITLLMLMVAMKTTSITASATSAEAEDILKGLNNYVMDSLTASKSSEPVKKEELLKDKTNKLNFSDDLVKNAKYIDETLAAGKTLTYKVEVSKGALYIDVMSESNYKVEIYDSKKKLVKRFEAYDMFRTYVVKEAAWLSKGKYSIKISPTNKKKALNISGKVLMINTSTSRTITLDKEHTTAITKGKTYKLIFELEEKSNVLISNLITPFSSYDYFPDYLDHYEIVNSKGETEQEYDGLLAANLVLKKGTYTLVFKAHMTGRLSTKISK
jgi:hypothetical protein